jgi:hypothetical protein
MKINPVHALLEVLRQQARTQAADSAKLKPGTATQEALRQQPGAQGPEGTTAKSNSSLEQILAESKDTKFRLEMLEKLVSDRLGVRITSPGSATADERLANSERPTPTTMASSEATDALNQTTPQSHGRAWHSQPDLWNNAEAEFLKYHVMDPGAKGAQDPIGIAEKFTPTVEDIETALFKEGADPAEFARVFMARGQAPFDASSPVFAPRLVPIFIGALMLLAVGYLIL